MNVHESVCWTNMSIHRKMPIFSGMEGEPSRQESNMCEANAYLLKEGKEELILEAVDKVDSEGDHIKIENIFGEQKRVHGRIRSMSLVNHKILIEE